MSQTSFNVMENGDKWEQRYQQLFAKYSSLKLSFDAEVRQRENAEDRLRKTQKLTDAAIQKERELEEFLTEMISERHGERKEVANLNERIREIMKNFLEEREQKVKEMEHMTFQLESKGAKLKKTQRNIDDMRREIVRLREKVADKENENKLIAEQNEQLNTIIAEIKEGAILKDVKISNPYDRIFSKYLESFHGDEADVRHLFQDRVTQGCNASFHLLISICLDDLIQNLLTVTRIVQNTDSLVDIVISKQLYMNFNRYLRLLQYKYMYLFSNGSDEANKKATNMTRHKMKYEEVELGNARQCFVVALLQSANVDKDAVTPNTLTPSQIKDANVHHRKETHMGSKRLPAGFS